jgi:Ca-activated chloride channel family protein
MQWMALHNLGFVSIIPVILLLYLLKRKYEDRHVSSVLLWKTMLHNLEVNRPFQKLRNNLLLLLQLIAAVLLLLALLKPMFPSEGVIAKHTVIVIDSSGSMMAKEGDTTRFEQAKSSVANLIERLDHDQAITLIDAGIAPRVLLAKSGNKATLLQKLNELTPRYGTADYRAALSLAKAIAASVPDSGIMWFGDGASERIPDTELSNLSPHAFRFVQAGMSKENLSIATFVTQSGENGMRSLLRIDNHGVQSKQGKVVIYDEQQQLLDAADFSVASRESRTLQFDNLPERRAYQAVLEAEGDRLAEDNTMWSVPFGKEQASVILVSPNGNRFLNEAVKLSRVQVETMTEVPKTVPSPPDLWIFDGVVPDTLQDGNLLLIGPSRATEWLPFGGVRDASADLEIAAESDPLLKYVDWRDVHIAKTAVLRDIPGMKALVRSGEHPVLLTGLLQGRRAAILSFDLHQSDLPLRPAFPILMQNALSWLTPVQSVPIGIGYPGETMTIPLTPGAASRSLVLPDGTEEEITGENSVHLFTVPEQLGLYRIKEYVGEREVERLFPVQMRPSESDITPGNIQVHTDRQQAGENRDTSANLQGMNGYRDLTLWLILLALLLVFVEWRVYQRGY